MSQTVIIVGRGSAQAAALSDPHFASVKLLMGFEGTDGSTTFDDESAADHSPFTVGGNAQIDTAQFKFGASSLLLDGTGDYLTLPDHADWTPGAGDYTWEAHVRFNAIASGQNQFVSHYNNTGNQRGWYFSYFQTSAILLFSWTLDGATAVNLSAAWSPSLATQYHVATVRDGTTMRLFIDGVGVATAAIGASDSIFDSTSALHIGAFQSSGVTGFLNGWIDELRLTKGVARYTANFTPPAAAYPRS